jgi:hypothetical protein
MKHFFLSLLLLSVGFGANGQCVNSSLIIYGSDNSFLSVKVTDNSSFSSSVSIGKDNFNCFAWTDNTHGSPNYNSRTIFKFDLASIPVGATINSAKLFLYPDTTIPSFAPHKPTYGTANDAFIERNTVSGDTNTIAWTNHPTTDTINRVTLPRSLSDKQSYILDMTAMVQDWVINPISNYGGTLRLQVEDYYNTLFFNSGMSSLATQLRLEICYTNPLPLQLLSFTATQNKSDVSITFNTNKEKNVKVFYIEKSLDAKSFETIASIKAKNTFDNNTYQFTDASFINSTVYYRLKMVYIDGKFNYSKVEKVIFSNHQQAINIYPNPTNTFVNIDCNNAKQIFINDYLGRIVMQSKVSQDKLVVDTKGFPKGIYTVRLVLVNGEIKTSKFIVN